VIVSGELQPLGDLSMCETLWVITGLEAWWTAQLICTQERIDLWSFGQNPVAVLTELLYSVVTHIIFYT